MPARARPCLESTDDWHQLHLLTQFPEQLTYELIRPVVLFGHSPAERAQQTGAAARTLYRQAARFAKDGMASLFAPRVEKHRRLPPQVRETILVLKAEHPALRIHEITTIRLTVCGHRPSPHTVKRILADGPLPILVGRRFPPYHQIADPVEARLAISRTTSTTVQIINVIRRDHVRGQRKWQGNCSRPGESIPPTIFQSRRAVRGIGVWPQARAKTW